MSSGMLPVMVPVWGIGYTDGEVGIEQGVLHVHSRYEHVHLWEDDKQFTKDELRKTSFPYNSEGTAHTMFQGLHHALQARYPDTDRQAPLRLVMTIGPHDKKDALRISMERFYVPKGTDADCLLFG